MCGRTACTLGPEDIPKACRFRGRNGDVQVPRWRKGSEGKYRASYNIAPQAYTPVLVSTKHVSSSELADETNPPERTLHTMKWGLVPNWFKGDPAKFEYKMNNARSDSLMSKASYKMPLIQGRRCVILADGFYEWKTGKDGKKQPYFIYFKSSFDMKQENAEIPCDTETSKPRRLLTMAGLFDCWKSPAILDGDEAVKQWLEYDNVPYTQALKCLKSVNCLDWHPVSTAMNNSRHNGPDCIAPIDLDKPSAVSSKVPSKGSITSFFTKSPKKEEASSPSGTLLNQSVACSNTPKLKEPPKSGGISSFFTKSPKKEVKEELSSPLAKKRKVQ
ncbi:abasic site processing protein HMCES isoform X2 [Nematostella vectensis]|uniref:abasic site processing protein HMCES isoform X2 n=1 Tax=Nematostella vectensis TaxID=45351 RepID=UPI0020776550|nr:abasic site processing protein HMCES isoform X2 [Nematostella vectensis]